MITLSPRKEAFVQILGIDPGLHITGYAVVNVSGRRPQLKEAGVLRIAARRSLPERIADLYRQVAELLGEFNVAHVGVEQLYAHYKHPRTAILMGHARGVILLAATQAGVPVVDLPSTLVKKTITGNGHAGKMQIQRAVAALCRLEKPPLSPDVADAIAIAWVLATRITMASGVKLQSGDGQLSVVKPPPKRIRRNGKAPLRVRGGRLDGTTSRLTGL